MKSIIKPPYSRLQDRSADLARQGYCLLDAAAVHGWLQTNTNEIERLHGAWGRLPPDPHLLDGGRYRRRRHGCFVVDGEQVEQAPHRPHWQSVKYNALHGGLQRWFDPVEPETASQPLWRRLLVHLGQLASELRGAQPWYLEAHPFRIDTTDGIGRPTPEGAHRDGVDLVAVMILERAGIKGGESRIFAADGPAGQRFTLDQPGSLMLLDDERVIHETTPIQPTRPDRIGWRDTLVVTLRQGGFQGE